jgi:phosphoglycolate phosphatase
MRAFNVALVDFDGTLVDTRGAVAECMRSVLREHSWRKRPETAISQVIASGAPLLEALQRLMPDLESGQVQDCVRRYRIRYPEFDTAQSVLYDGVQSTVRYLATSGIEVVVMSNKGRAAVEATLVRFGLADSVAHVLADYPGEPTKPDPEVFHRRVVGIFGTKPRSDYIVVGDTEADLEFSRRVGIKSCWATYGYGNPVACRALAPDYEIRAFSELIKIASTTSR